MKTLALLVVSTSALLLSACGGSSDSHVSTSTPLIQNQDHLLITSSEITNITIDGKEFNVRSDGIKIDDYFVASKNNTSINSGTSLRYAKFGIAKDAKSGKEFHFFACDRTYMLPIRTINYSGRAMYECKNCDGIKFDGRVGLTADFSQKRVTGNLTLPSATKNLAMAGNIVDKNFSGTHINGTFIEGGFHGIIAEEVSGTFINKKEGIAGSFGAKKQ